MLKLFIIFSVVFLLTSCANSNSSNSVKDISDSLILAKGEKMDTAHFWRIMDYGFNKGNFNNKAREKAILEQLIKLTPEQIQEFEIIFQQMNKKASTYELLAAQTVIEGGSSDDRFYYFRCWLISLGQSHFYEAVKNADYLASLDIPYHEQYGMTYCQFEELIPMADNAYEIVTRNDPAKDTSFPRSHAERKGLFYDSGTPMTGMNWESNAELSKIVPNLCKKYSVK